MSVSLSPDAALAYLTEHLGEELVILMGLGEANPGSPDGEPDRELGLARLDAAVRATQVLVENYGDTTAQSWFMGRNPGLEGEAPVIAVREASNREMAEAVHIAALAFTV